MACGCAQKCTCTLSEGTGISIIGSGDTGNPYVISANETVFSATNADGTVDITPGGPAGHQPNFDLLIDPASTAIVSKSPAGLRIDDSGIAPTPVTVSDTNSVDLTLAAGNITADVIDNATGGIKTTGTGIAIKLDPASPAGLSTGAAGLSVDCCQMPQYKASRNTALNINSAGTDITWNHEVYDIGFGIAPGITLAVPDTGLYLIEFQIKLDFQLTTDNIQARIEVNGTNVAQRRVKAQNNGAENHQFGVECVRRISAGGLVGAVASLSTNTSLVGTGDNDTYITITKLSD